MIFTNVEITITIAIGLSTIAGGFFGLGALWSKKMNKADCERMHTEMNKTETDKSKEFWEVINALRHEVSRLTTTIAILNEKVNSIEKSINVEQQISKLREEVRHASQDRTS